MTLKPACLLAPLLLVASLASSQPSPLRIGDATARAGTAVSGFIDIPAGADSGTGIPVSIIRGSAVGPTLALIAGTHGSEVAPIIALQRVRQSLDPAQIRGTLILVHIANMPSFLARTIYYSPIDRKNLNRVYPGKRDGSVSERIAEAITREVIDRSDYLVDIHSGDGNESLRPYTYWSKLGLDARTDSLGRMMALAWGNDHIVVDTDRPRDLKASVYTQNTAHLRGKPSITTEAGYLGVAAEDMVQRNVDGAFRLMRFLRMLPGEVQLVEHPVWLDRTAVLTSPGTGVWHPRVDRGTTVQRGTVIGELSDFFGNVVAQVRAPFAGEVLYIVGTPAMSKGEPVGMIGQAAKENDR